MTNSITTAILSDIEFKVKEAIKRIEAEPPNRAYALIQLDQILELVRGHQINYERTTSPNKTA